MKQQEEKIREIIDMIKQGVQEIWQMFGVLAFITMFLAWLAAMWLLDQNKTLIHKQFNLINKEQVMLKNDNKVVDACYLIVNHMTPQQLCQVYYMKPCTTDGELMATSSATLQ